MVFGLAPAPLQPPKLLPVLADRIASRSEQAAKFVPFSSADVVTWMVAAQAGPAKSPHAKAASASASTNDRTNGRRFSMAPVGPAVAPLWTAAQGTVSKSS